MKDQKPSYGWKTRFLFAIAARFSHWVMYIYFSTCRVKCINKENEDQYLREGKPTLFVSWHQGLIYFVHHFRNRNGIIMVSQSKDGELIHQLLKRYGYQSARGSSSRGGKKALKEMIDIINETQCSGGLVADAPRGPFGIAKMGIIKIAKETGVPLIPVMYWAKKKKLFNNWDRTMLPMPFTRIVFYYEKPIIVPKDATDEQMEQIRSDLTDQLNDMHKEAQKCFDK